MIYGSDFHHIDHLLPLCSLIEAPVYVTDEAVFTSCKESYPSHPIYLSPPAKFASDILDNTEVLISTLPRQLLDPLFFFEEHLKKKKLLSLWLPHGNSDKKNLSALSQEKIALIYGDLMQERLAETHILSKLYRFLRVGNYRRHFYLEHLEFFCKGALMKLYFPKKQKTVLFAPSWEDPELHKKTEKLIALLPDRYNLLIKPHPNSLKKPHFEVIREKVAEKSNIVFLENYPPIYPILAEADIYLGDHSSVAYDFLSFNRPMYFLAKTGNAIEKAGEVVSIETLFDVLEKPDQRKKERKQLYRKAFDESVDFDSLKQLIEDAISSYFEEEIHLL